MANQPQIFKYQSPDLETMRAMAIRKSGNVGRSHFPLCKTDLVVSGVLVIAGGGEQELHYHTGNDGFWFVLQGRVRYYTDDDAVVAALGKHEGILIPRGFNYWFSSVGDEPLEILHVAAMAQDTKDMNVHVRTGIVKESGLAPT